MSDQLKQCAEPHLYFMKELSKASRRRAKKLMELAPDKFMSFMTSAAHNVMKGNLELDPECYKNLRKKRQKMLDVGWVKSKKERKRNLRKHGGTLGRDLSKVILSALECQQPEEEQEEAEEGTAAESLSPKSCSSS